ncbi:MAG: ketoacyl-ACP synthase III [Hyphomicrobiaceae bacterium]
MSIGIEAIAGYVPLGRRDNLERLEAFGVTADFIDNKIGVRALPVKGPDEDTSDLACRAIEAVLAQSGRARHDVDALVLCTQNPDGYGLPHTSAIVHGKLGLGKQCLAFDISLGCSGFVYGLATLQSLMEAQGLKTGLLVTADPYSKVVSIEDKNTSLLFGDAAAATLLTSPAEGAPRLRLVKALFGTDGTERQALEVGPDRVLRMNGREVFNFSATTVPTQIKDLLAAAHLTIADIDLFLFHQGSKYIVDTLVRRLGLPPEKVPIAIGETGNTVSSSIPLILRHHLAPGADRRILVSGFGVGLSYASAILEWSS